MATHLNELLQAIAITIIKIIITKDNLDFESNHGSVECSNPNRIGSVMDSFSPEHPKIQTQIGRGNERKKNATTTTKLDFVFLS